MALLGHLAWCCSHLPYLRPHAEGAKPGAGLQWVGSAGPEARPEPLWTAA
jgi:hypothetical protein